MKVYPVQQWYAVSVAICLLVAGLFAPPVFMRLEPGAALFLLIALAVAAWQWRAARTRVALSNDRLIVQAPMTPAREVEFRQLLTVVQEGRVNPTILVMYHPRTDDGLLNLDAVQTLNLPAVQDQDGLLERLEGHVPQ